MVTLHTLQDVVVSFGAPLFQFVLLNKVLMHASFRCRHFISLQVLFPLHPRQTQGSRGHQGGSKSAL